MRLVFKKGCPSGLLYACQKEKENLISFAEYHQYLKMDAEKQALYGTTHK